MGLFNLMGFLFNLIKKIVHENENRIKNESRRDAITVDHDAEIINRIQNDPYFIQEHKIDYLPDESIKNIKEYNTKSNSKLRMSNRELKNMVYLNSYKAYNESQN